MIKYDSLQYTENDMNRSQRRNTRIRRKDIRTQTKVKTREWKEKEEE